MAEYMIHSFITKSYNKNIRAIKSLVKHAIEHEYKHKSLKENIKIPVEWRKVITQS